MVRLVQHSECNLGKGCLKRQCSGANPSIYRSFVVSSTPLISRAHRLTLEINGADTRGVRSPDDSWSEMACMLPAFAVHFNTPNFLRFRSEDSKLPALDAILGASLDPNLECSARRARTAREIFHRNCMEYNDKDATANCNNQNHMKSICV